MATVVDRNSPLNPFGQGVQPIRNIRGTPTRRVSESFNPQRWWESPGLQFVDAPTGDPQRPGTAFIQVPGGGVYSVTVPTWFQGQSNDPKTFYGWYDRRRNSPELETTVLSFQEADTIRRERQDAIQTAIEGLRGTAGGFEGALGAYRDDPMITMIGEELARRAGPEYSAIAPQEEQSIYNTLAQNLARQRATRLGSSAGRGSAGSGTTLQGQATLQGIADAARSTIQARTIAENQAARDRALVALDQFTRGRYGVEQSYLDRLGQIESEIARLQTLDTREPTDFTALDMLEYGRDLYDRESAFRDRALSAYEREATPDFWDWVRGGATLVNSGIPETVVDWLF